LGEDDCLGEDGAIATDTFFITIDSETDCPVAVSIKAGNCTKNDLLDLDDSTDEIPSSVNICGFTIELINTVGDNYSFTVTSDGTQEAALSHITFDFCDCGVIVQDPTEGCYPVDREETVCPGSVVGEWEVYLYTGTTLHERFIVITSQEDGEIEGVFGVGYDPEGAPTGDITGEVDCFNIYMFYDREDYVDTGYTAELWGTIESDGNAMSGIWTDNKSYPTPQNWSAVRLP
jgi:hypothetical protein